MIHGNTALVLDDLSLPPGSLSPPLDGLPIADDYETPKKWMPIPVPDTGMLEPPPCTFCGGRHGRTAMSKGDQAICFVCLDDVTEAAMIHLGDEVGEPVGALAVLH